jgi:hypothetical protein
MSGLRYYYPSDAEEASAPPGVEVECDGSTITLVVDADCAQSAQIVELTGEEAMRLAGALNRAALAALPEVER